VARPAALGGGGAASVRSVLCVVCCLLGVSEIARAGKGRGRGGAVYDGQKCLRGFCCVEDRPCAIGRLVG
jgi:hypothetical protein